MHRLINASLAILVASTLTAPAVKAAQTRYEYQLQLTHHEVPATPTKQISQSLAKVAAQAQQGQMATAEPTLKPVTAGNPYKKAARPTYNVQ